MRSLSFVPLLVVLSCLLLVLVSADTATETATVRFVHSKASGASAATNDADVAKQKDIRDYLERKLANVEVIENNDPVFETVEELEATVAAESKRVKEELQKKFEEERRLADAAIARQQEMRDSLLKQLKEFEEVYQREAAFFNSLNTPLIAPEPVSQIPVPQELPVAAPSSAWTSRAYWNAFFFIALVSSIPVLLWSFQLSAKTGAHPAERPAYVAILTKEAKAVIARAKTKLSGNASLPQPQAKPDAAPHPAAVKSQPASLSSSASVGKPPLPSSSSSIPRPALTNSSSIRKSAALPKPGAVAGLGKSAVLGSSSGVLKVSSTKVSGSVKYDVQHDVIMTDATLS